MDQISLNIMLFLFGSFRRTIISLHPIITIRNASLSSKLRTQVFTQSAIEASRLFGKHEHSPIMLTEKAPLSSK